MILAGGWGDAGFGLDAEGEPTCVPQCGQKAKCSGQG
jgi:hypothetical protein